MSAGEGRSGFVGQTGARGVGAERLGKARLGRGQGEGDSSERGVGGWGCGWGGGKGGLQGGRGG